MSRRKKSRKGQRAAGMIVGAASRVEVGPREEFVTNGRARAKVLTWAVTVTFAYGVINNLILGRPERRVNVEIVFICASTLVLQIGLYHAGSRYFQTGRAWVSRLWERFSRFEHWSYAPAVTALVFAISLSFMTLISVPNFQAWVVDFRLDHLTKNILAVQAASRSQDQLAAPFEKLLSTLKTSAALDVPVDTERVERARNAIAQSLASRELSEGVKVSGWETMAGLGAYADYRSIQQGGQVPRPVLLGSSVENEAFVLNSAVELKDKPAWFTGAQSRVVIGDVVGFRLSNARVIFDNLRFEGEFNGATPILLEDDKSKVLVRNSTFKNVTQDLQRISWENVQFNNSVISYSGGTVNLYMVKFQQCNLQFGDDSVSQDLKLRILRANGQPISFAAGSP